MKKVDYLYYIVLLTLWPLVDRLLSTGTRISPLFFWLLPLYAAWFIGSPFLLYWLRQGLPFKKSFHASQECKMEWSTFWLDEERGELAALFILNPFHIQYIAVPRIDSMDVRLDGLTADRKYVQQICVLLVIDGKTYRMRACSMGRFGPVGMDGYGGMVLRQVQGFAGAILEVKQRMCEDNNCNPTFPKRV